MAQLLLATGLTKHWKGLPEPVLEDVDLELAEGDCIWVTGGNGVGKTTLMRIVSGLIRPESGTITLDGLSPERDRREYQRRVGMLAAGDRGLYARLSVRQHLHMWARVSFLPRDARATSVAEAITRFELERIVAARVDRMSMGQRQRLRLALTLMHHPRLVLLDEPLNSLDEAGAALLGRELDEVIARGGAVLWISPGNDHPDRGFDRRLRLAAGSLVPA